MIYFASHYLNDAAKTFVSLDRKCGINSRVHVAVTVNVTQRENGYSQSLPDVFYTVTGPHYFR